MGTNRDGAVLALPWSMHEDAITQDVIGCSIALHRKYGSGMLESVYKDCLAVDLVERGYEVAVEQPIPLVYKGLNLRRAFILDLFVNRTVIVEVKCVSQILDIHVAQLSTYLRLTGAKVGLILNFRTLVLKNGIRRVVNNYEEPKEHDSRESPVAKPTTTAGRPGPE